MRVAALLPAATDIVIALGAGDQLVAVTHACTLPARLSDVPRVTRSRVAATGAAGIDCAVSELSSAGAPLFELDEALLAAQRPDVLLTQAVCDVCAVREEDVRAVASRLRPVPEVTTLGAGSVEGVINDIARVGSALDIPDEAEELVAGLQSRIAAIHRRLKANAAPRPNVLVLDVARGSPAYMSGLKGGDIIVSVGRGPVTSPLSVQRAIETAGAQELTLRVIRKKKPQSLTLRW